MKPLNLLVIDGGTTLLMQEAQRASLEGRPSPYSLAAFAEKPSARDLAVAAFDFWLPSSSARH